MAHAVTKDLSGWGFAVKQGVTTIHKDSAAYMVLTSGLAMEVEAVTRALRWTAPRGDGRTTHAIPSQIQRGSYKKNEKWNWTP